MYISVYIWYVYIYIYVTWRDCTFSINSIALDTLNPHLPTSTDLGSGRHLFWPEDAFVEPNHTKHTTPKKGNQQGVHNGPHLTFLEGFQRDWQELFSSQAISGRKSFKENCNVPRTKVMASYCQPWGVLQFYWVGFFGILILVYYN